MTEREDPLDRAAEVAGPDRSPVGVPDARAEVERVRRAAIGRHRQGGGKVGDERVAVRAARAPVADQPVVRHAPHLPYDIRPGDRGISVLAYRWYVREQRERAPAMAR